MIAKNLHLLDEFDFDMVDPWRFFAGLLYEDMANLADEIKEYKVWGSVEVWEVAGSHAVILQSSSYLAPFPTLGVYKTLQHIVRPIHTFHSCSHLPGV